MDFNVVYYYEKRFLPSKRHRKIREKQDWGVCHVSIPDVTEQEFPVAFIVHDFAAVYKDVKNYRDFENKEGEYRSFAEPIRTHNGKLYKLFRITHGAAISEIPESKETVLHELERPVEKRFMEDVDFPISSIVISDNTRQQEEKIKRVAEQFLYFNGTFWRECSEPRYVINTFGLGHNHGGTGFFVEDYYNHNIPAKNYFSALQREEAVAYGKAVAERRGDTKSIDMIGEHSDIEVLMPEMVKVDPKKQHGNGCSFLNDCEELIVGSDSVGEAGMLCVLNALKGKHHE